MLIRQFQPEDQDSVIALWDRCGLLRPWNNPVQDIHRKLDIDPEGFLVGVADGRLVGCVMVGYDGHRGWVNYLAVDPDRRQLGLGRRIMDAAIALLEARNCPKINLQIRADNDDVIAFYTALGFSEDPVVSMGKRLIKDD